MTTENNHKDKDSKILEIKNLKVEYRTLEGTVYAVNGLDVALNHGETIGLVGETGAGKTTTAMSILRLLPKQAVITSGEIMFEGKSLIKASEDQMRKIRGNSISMIFQDPMSSLNPVFTIKHQIAEAVKVHQDVSWDKANERAIDMLKAVGITEDRADDYPFEFSGGMIQRAMIAIALSCQPRLLIADEPTTALDVTIQAQVMDLIKNLKKQFKTSMILITHDLGVIPEVCDKVAVIYAGRVVEQGSIRDIYKNALHPYTKGLFKCIPDVAEPDKQLSPIPGLSPSARLLAAGCPFYTRCTVHMDKCEISMPKLVEITDNHKTACFLFDKCN